MEYLKNQHTMSMDGFLSIYLPQDTTKQYVHGWISSQPKQKSQTEPPMVENDFDISKFEYIIFKKK